jgi:hypothetical protein
MNLDKSDRELRVDELVRQTGTVTHYLRELADRLDRTAEAFRDPNVRGGAAGVAADIVNIYVQGCGPQGTFLWTIVRESAELDRDRPGSGSVAS